jgi:hypothetical protein
VIVEHGSRSDSGTWFKERERNMVQDAIAEHGSRSEAEHGSRSETVHGSRSDSGTRFKE